MSYVDKEKNEFKKKSLLELRKKSVEEINKYYRDLRKYEYDAGIELKGIEFRKKIHKLLLLILKIDRMLKGEKIVVLNDKRSLHDKPVIFAATHIGGNDIERVFEAIKEHAYIMLGDPGIVYVNEIGLILNLNGVLPIDTRNKEDRNIAYNRAIELLKKGGNLLIFPEGAYNVFENLPVMKIYPGAVRMSQETGCDIIPLAIEQYDNTFWINIGENVNFSNYLSIKEANDALRDILASLKWEIWENQKEQSRDDFTYDYIMNFRQSVVDRDEYGDYVYTLNDIYETMYHDKNVISADDVFSCLENIEINAKNAFLLKLKKK